MNNNIIGYIISGIIVLIILTIAIIRIYFQKHEINKNKVNIQSIYSEFIKEHMGLFIVITILVCISLAIKVIFIPKKVSDISVESANIKFSKDSFFKQIFQSNSVPYILLAISVGWIIMMTIDFITTTIFSYLKPKLHSHVTDEINEHILNANQNSLDKGQIVSRSNRLINNLTRITSISRTVLPCVLAIVFMNVYLYIVDYKIGIIMTISISISSTYIYFNNLNINDLTVEESRNFHKKSELLNDIVTNHENIILNNEQDNYNEKTRQNNETYENSLSKLLLVERNQTYISGIISVLTFIIIMYVVYKQVQAKKLSNVMFGSIVIILLLYIDWNLTLENNLPELLSEYEKLNDFEQYLQNVLKNPEHVVEKYNDIINNNIKIKNLTVKINNITLFKDFNLIIPKNQKIGIFGKTGKGKSTLLKCIFGLIKPEHGDVYIGDHINYEYNQKKLREQMVFINQNTSLTNTTIIDNLQQGNDLSKTEIIDFLNKYNLMNVFKKGIDYKIDLNGQNTSKGMQKVIFVVRGLLRKNTKIILLDEPTASIDKNTKESIIKAIKDHTKNKTVVCVSHDKDIKKILDKTIEL